MWLRGRAAVGRVLQRLPGAHAVTVWTWALPLLLALTMLPFTTAGSAYWQRVSLQAYGVAAVVSAVGLVAARPWLRGLRVSARSGVVVLIAYAAVAAVSVIVAIAVLPDLRSPDRPALIGSVESVLLYAIASTGAGGVAAWSLSWRARLRQALRESRLRARQAQQALDEQQEMDALLRSRGSREATTRVATPLAVVIDSLADRSDAELREAAMEIRRIATDEVRPLSHSLHPVEPMEVADNNDDAIGAGISWRVVAPLKQPVPVVGIWLLSVPGALLIPATGPGSLWAAVPDLGVLALGLWVLRLGLRPCADLRRVVQWLLLIMGLGVVGAAAGIAFALALGEPWSSLIATGAIVHVISGVALSLGRGWGGAMRAEIALAQQEALLARSSLTLEIADIDRSRRHAADVLHSRVQSRLVAIADLLDFAAAGNREDLQRGLEELQDTCNNTLPEVIRILEGERSADLPFSELIRSMWPNVDIRCDSDVDALAMDDEVLAGVLLEACANAIRHGSATVINIECVENGSVLRVRDNGSGPAADASAGLGMSAIAVHSPGWSLERVDGWTELRLPIVAVQDHSRGAPAIAR